MKARLWTSFLIMTWLFSPGMIFSASKLNFDASGMPSELVLGGVDFMNGRSPGFKLSYSDDNGKKELALSEVATSGNKIKVSHPGSSPSFVFQIDAYPNHVAIHLLQAQGIGSGHGYSLSLEFNSTDIAAYTLNDYMTTNAGNSRRKDTELKWPYLWAWPRPNGTHGSVVLYDGSLEGSAKDAVLAEIWSVQSKACHMVRPAGQPRWSEADLLAWVERWVNKFETMVNVCIAPESEEELYEMTERLVIPLGANRVYMFSTHWRGEYHIFDLTNESVAGKAFPDGKESLLKYSNYLANSGAHLQLKSLVPHLGRNNKRYFSDTHCETRFLSWGSGKLVESIDTSAKTIQFQPGPDYVWEQQQGFVRIGVEMVHTEAITIDPSSGVWTLAECERGYAGTSPHADEAGAEIVGVLDSYSYFHHADDFGQPNSLAEQILNPYGDFLNEMNVGHLHFDGTGHKKEAPWYLRNYTDYVYSRVDQPVTGSRVGGSIKANFEREFSIAEQARKATGYWGIRIGPRLDGMGRGAEKAQRNFAPNMMDMHFDIADRILLGGRRPNFTGGRSGGILDMNILDNYGLMEEALELYKDWVVLAPVYDDADVEYIETQMKKRRGSSHYEGEDIVVLSQNGNGDYIYTPHRVMGRTSGEDPLIHIDQEWGASPRYQKIQAGASMELLNPYEEQEPQVVIFVEEKSSALKDPIIRVNGGGLAVTGEVQPTEYMKYIGGDSVVVYDKNWNRLRNLPAMNKSFVFNKGTNTVTTSDGAGSNEPKLKVQYITKGPVYVLETNKHLSDQPTRSNGMVHQAESMELEGYQVGNSAGAACGKYVAADGQGIAGMNFSGEEGIYTIEVHYFKGRGGHSSYGLRVDGGVLDTWATNHLDDVSGSSSIARQIHRIPGVRLKSGSLIELASVANGALDQIVIIPSAK